MFSRVINPFFSALFIFALLFWGCGGDDGSGGQTPTTSNLQIVNPSSAFTIKLGQEVEVTASGGNGTYQWSVTGGANIVETRGASAILKGSNTGSFKVTVQSGNNTASLDFTVEPGVNDIKINTLNPSPGPSVRVKFGNFVKVKVHYSAAQRGTVVEVFASEDGTTKVKDGQSARSVVDPGEGDLELSFTVVPRQKITAEVTTTYVVANIIDKQANKILDHASKKARYQWVQ